MDRSFKLSTRLRKQEQKKGEISFYIRIMAHAHQINTMLLLWPILDSATTRPEWVRVLQPQVSSMAAESLLIGAGSGLGCFPFTHTHLLSSLPQGPGSRHSIDHMSRTCLPSACCYAHPPPPKKKKHTREKSRKHLTYFQNKIQQP